MTTQITINKQVTFTCLPCEERRPHVRLIGGGRLVGVTCKNNPSTTNNTEKNA